MEHVINSRVLAHLLDRHQRTGVGNHADCRAVAREVGADRADLQVGQILADGTAVDIALGFKYRLGKSLRLRLGHINDRKGKTHRRALADTAELAELFGKKLERLYTFGHDQNAPSGMPYLAASADISFADAS